MYISSNPFKSKLRWHSAQLQRIQPIQPIQLTQFHSNAHQHPNYARFGMVIPVLGVLPV